MLHDDVTRQLTHDRQARLLREARDERLARIATDGHDRGSVRLRTRRGLQRLASGLRVRAATPAAPAELQPEL
jgi:hypothetical protein